MEEITKMKDIVDEIEKEIKEEDLSAAKGVIKNRLREIQDMKRVLGKMEKHLENLLEKSPEEIIHG